MGLGGCVEDVSLMSSAWMTSRVTTILLIYVTVLHCGGAREPPCWCRMSLPPTCAPWLFLIWGPWWVPISSVSKESESELEAVYMCIDSARMDIVSSVLSQSLYNDFLFDLFGAQLWDQTLGPQVRETPCGGFPCGAQIFKQQCLILSNLYSAKATRTSRGNQTALTLN